ncbi:hypothetical protein G4X40_20275 [Rhodococcus sp. D2-41]|uniref:hypothetical protein n=1 Tax=Speluncibacter jeojiensis TaxID=2710754 RepID=UPI0024104A90|nr:hypothetical protein [Rhodococcus sp. D2-41]MDG3012480.1 hypothetical protein [Rhodococcus sp. D2-41]
MRDVIDDAHKAALAAADRETEDLARAIGDAHCGCGDESCWSYRMGMNREGFMRAARAAHAHILPAGSRIIGPHVIEAVSRLCTSGAEGTIDVALARATVRAWLADDKHETEKVITAAQVRALGTDTLKRINEAIPDGEPQSHGRDFAVGGRIPRTWDRLAYVPRNMIVRDRDGDEWFWETADDDWVRGDRSAGRFLNVDQSCAPWTEVLP